METLTLFGLGLFCVCIIWSSHEKELRYLWAAAAAALVFLLLLEFIEGNGRILPFNALGTAFVGVPLFLVVTFVLVVFGLRKKPTLVRKRKRARAAALSPRHYTVLGWLGRLGLLLCLLVGFREPIGKEWFDIGIESENRAALLAGRLFAYPEEEHWKALQAKAASPRSAQLALAMGMPDDGHFNTAISFAIALPKSDERLQLLRAYSTASTHRALFEVSHLLALYDAGDLEGFEALLGGIGNNQKIILLYISRFIAAHRLDLVEFTLQQQAGFSRGGEWNMAFKEAAKQDPAYMAVVLSSWNKAVQLPADSEAVNNPLAKGLAAAVKASNVPVMRMLIQAGAGVEATEIYDAAACQAPRIMEILLLERAAMPRLNRPDVSSALSKAVQCGNVAVKLMLQATEVNVARDANGKTGPRR